MIQVTLPENPTTLDMLLALRDQIFTEESRWCKGHYGMTQDREPCSTNSPLCCSVCLLGACRVVRRAFLATRMTGPCVQFFDLVGILCREAVEIKRLRGKSDMTFGVDQFNDLEWVTFEDIRALLDRSIETTRSQNA